MQRIAKSMLVVLSLALFISAAYSQDEAKKEKRKRDKKGKNAAEAAFRLPDEIVLTSEQNEKLEALKKEYQPKLREVQNAMDELMTPERKRAAKEARKAAKEAGQKGKQAQQAVDDALKLTDAERVKLGDLRAKERQLRSEVDDKIRAMLTAEQREKMPQQKKGKKKRDR